MYTYSLKKNNKLKHPYIHIRHEKRNTAGPGEGSCVVTLPHLSLLPQFHGNRCLTPPPLLQSFTRHAGLPKQHINLALPDSLTLCCTGAAQQIFFPPRFASQTPQCILGIHAFLMGIVVAYSVLFLSTIPGYVYCAIHLPCLPLVEIRIWAIRNVAMNIHLQCCPQPGAVDSKCRISGSDSRATTSEFAF